MEFAADKYCAVIGGVKIFVEGYSFARSSALGETVLINGGSVLHNGGRAARITVSGKSETGCVHLLDSLLLSCTPFSFEYGETVFENAVLTGYECKGESGKSETVTAELVCTEQVGLKGEEA